MKLLTTKLESYLRRAIPMTWSGVHTLSDKLGEIRPLWPDRNIIDIASDLNDYQQRTIMIQTLSYLPQKKPELQNFVTTVPYTLWFWKNSWTKKTYKIS